MSHDAWKLSPPPDRASGPCVCEGDAEDHDVDEQGNTVCRHCASYREALRCTEYREAEPCACGALVSRNCRCD